MEVKVGQYYYRKHRNMWGVWKKGKDDKLENGDTFISDFATQIQAKNFVYKMNGYTIKTDKENGE